MATLLMDSDMKDARIGLDTAEKAARVYGAQGIQVRAAWPDAGMDFNDVLRLAT